MACSLLEDELLDQMRHGPGTSCGREPVAGHRSSRHRPALKFRNRWAPWPPFTDASLGTQGMSAMGGQHAVTGEPTPAHFHQATGGLDAGAVKDPPRGEAYRLESSMIQRQSRASACAGARSEGA